jgi:radical SAM protein with 4Fe4S-binding SPASM domain
MPAVPDMSFQNFSLLLDKLVTHSVKILDIIGGEPTLHADIMPIIRETKRRGLHTNLSTNGTNIETLLKIQQAGAGITVGISINERNMLQKLNQFIRNGQLLVKTVFSPTMDFTLITDILQCNPHKFFLLYRDDVDVGKLLPTIPFYQFMSGAQQRFYAASKINTIYCSGFLPDTKQYPELAGMRCPAGSTKLGVLPDGSVYPCNLFFGKKEFLLGNILNDSFEAIWNHSVLAFFRTFTGNCCPRKTCELHMQCHGGCPAHAFIHAGDLAAPDPRCM